MNITHALQEFGNLNGRPGLHLSAGASVAIDLPDLPLTLEDNGEELLLMTGFPAPFLATERLLAMLQACEQRAARPDEPGLQLGLRGKASDIWVIAALRWPALHVSATHLQRGATQLRRFREAWAS